MNLVPTEAFEQTAKELLSNAEMLLALETIEDNPSAGINVDVDGEEFGDRIKFIQFPVTGKEPSRKGHFIKVVYAVFDDGERVVLMVVTTEMQWARWLRNVSTRDVIVEGLRFVARKLLTGA